MRPLEQIQVSERAEKHPEIALDPNAQPHLVLLPLPEHRGSQGHRLLPMLAHFIDEETETLWDPKTVTDEAKSWPWELLTHGPAPAGCLLPAATFSWGCLGSPVRAVSGADSSLGWRGAWHMAGTHQVLSQYWFY